MSVRDGTPKQPYSIVGPGDSTPPQYARVVRSLNNREIEEELTSERAATDEGWREALLAEQARR